MSRRKHKNKKWWQNKGKTLTEAIKDINAKVKGTGVDTAGNSYTHQYTYPGKSWFKTCSHEITPIYTLGNDEHSTITFCAATKEQVKPWLLQTTDLVLNVSGYSLGTSSNELLKGPAEFEDLKTLLPPSHLREVILSWIDGLSFPATVEFWQRFYDICQEQHYKRVIACCLGGHGRTGTALAALLIANGGMDDLEATAFIQKEYCEEAIETKSQENYLEQLYYEIHPEAEPKRAEAKKQLSLLPKSDRVVIDLTTDKVVDEKADKQPSNIDAYENRKCAWCAETFLADKHNKDDISCSEECQQSIEEFTGYQLSGV